MKNKILTIFLSIFFFGCEMDKKIDIVVIANDGDSPLIIVTQPHKVITDSLLYHEYVGETTFGAREVRTISLPLFTLHSLPDSEKMYLFIFNLDSIQKFRNDKRIDGIFRKSLIKEISVQLNKVDDNLDTIYVNK